MCQWSTIILSLLIFISTIIDDVIISNRCTAHNQQQHQKKFEKYNNFNFINNKCIIEIIEIIMGKKKYKIKY